MTNGNGQATGITLPKIIFTTSIPNVTRGRGGGGGENPYKKFMIEMPAPAQPKDAKGKPVKDAPLQFAQFFVPSEVPDTITDPAEREKAAKANTPKLVNRFTSISRMIRKTMGETHDYAFRKARDPSVADDKGTWGILVYRIQPGTDKGGPGKKAASTGATTGAAAT